MDAGQSIQQARRPKSLCGEEQERRVGGEAEGKAVLRRMRMFTPPSTRVLCIAPLGGFPEPTPQGVSLSFFLSFCLLHRLLPFWLLIP